MKILKKLIMTVLLMMLMSTLSFADSNGFSNFTNQNTYLNTTFKDVPENAWYANQIQYGYELGLVGGKGEGKFDPMGNVTIAEALTLAAKVHAKYYGNEIQTVDGGAWYDAFAQYCYENGIANEEKLSNYSIGSTYATREQVAWIFGSILEAYDVTVAKALPPDGQESEFYEEIVKLYKAGIISGSDEVGTFYPNRNITRAETVTILNKIVDPSRRKTASLESEDENDDTPVGSGYKAMIEAKISTPSDVILGPIYKTMLLDASELNTKNYAYTFMLPNEHGMTSGYIPGCNVKNYNGNINIYLEYDVETSNITSAETVISMELSDKDEVLETVNRVAESLLTPLAYNSFQQEFPIVLDQVYEGSQYTNAKRSIEGVINADGIEYTYKYEALKGAVINDNLVRLVGFTFEMTDAKTFPFEIIEPFMISSKIANITASSAASAGFVPILQSYYEFYREDQDSYAVRRDYQLYRQDGILDEGTTMYIDSTSSDEIIDYVTFSEGDENSEFDFLYGNLMQNIKSGIGVVNSSGNSYTLSNGGTAILTAVDTINTVKAPLRESGYAEINTHSINGTINY